MAIFDPKDMEKVGKSEWLTGADFEGDGLVLKIKSVEKVKSQYGAGADNAMVERAILQEGETFRYVFEDVGGNDRQFDSHSMPFMIGMTNAEFNFGDWLFIKRTGKLRDTRYTPEKVDAPVSQNNSEEESIDPSSVPF